MIRKIIQINTEKCNGCGLCAEACHEGAIGMENGKARLLRDDYCDGLGDCLPVCPTGAITFEEREAEQYNEAAVKAHMALRQPAAPAGGCPGSRPRSISHASSGPAVETERPQPVSRLNQWPVQIRLVPVNAPYFEGAHLLIAADCSAFACGDFHERYMKNRITLIGCPKLDEGDYADKLTAILTQNNIKSVTVARMEVPCCGGIEHAVKTALQRCGKMIPWQVAVLSTDGRELND